MTGSQCLYGDETLRKAGEYAKEIAAFLSASLDPLGRDMGFMNLNQSAHGDREHGFVATRMRIARKVAAGYFRDASVTDEIGAWARSAVGHCGRKKAECGALWRHDVANETKVA